MLSLLESEVSRCVLQATRSKLRPPSPCRPRLQQPNKRSRSEDVGSGASSSGQRGRSPLRVGTFKTPDGGTGRGSSSLQAWCDRQRQHSLNRRCASGTNVVSFAPELIPDQLPTDLIDLNLEDFKRAKPFESIPGPTAIYHSIPYAGTRLLFFPFTNHKPENVSELLNKLQEDHGPVVRVRLGKEWVVLVDDLADIERVVRAAEKDDFHGREVVKPEASVVKAPLALLRPRVQDPVLSWLGTGSARIQKLKAAISFHLSCSVAAEDHLAQQETVATDLANNIAQLQGCPQELQSLFYRFAMESVGQSCFNRRLGLLGEDQEVSEETRQVVDSYRTVVKSLGEVQAGTRLLHLLFDDPFSKKFKEAQDTVSLWERKVMREATMHAIRDKGPQAVESQEDSLYISMLDDESVSEQDIYHTVHALLTIGSDSLSSSLQMLLYCLALDMDRQEKLASEVAKVLGTDGHLSPATLQQMDFLKAVVKESLRLHSPLPAGARVELSNNIVLNKYLVPAGTPIILNSQRTSRSSQHFHHPNHFMPERWLGEGGASGPTLAFLPQGVENVHCVHRASSHFAHIDLYAAAVKIIQKYRVTIPEEYQKGQLDVVFGIFRSPRQPLPFSFNPRPS